MNALPEQSSGVARHVHRVVEARGSGRSGQARVPRVQDVPVHVRVGVVRRHRQPASERPAELAKRSRVEQLEESFVLPPPFQVDRPEDEQSIGRAEDDRSERRLFVLALLDGKAAVRLLHLDGHEPPLDAALASVVDEDVRPSGRKGQRVDVLEVGRVVRLHVPEPIVEPCAQDRDADERGPVEIDAAWQGDVRLPIERRPAEMRVAEEDGTAGRRSSRPTAPRRSNRPRRRRATLPSVRAPYF